VVTRIERRYAAFDGLNLTWETLEGIVKHNGPLTDREGRGLGKYASGLPHAIQVHSAQQDLELWSHAGPEAQVAALADDIAYDVHDLDDGMRARMFSLDELEPLPLVGDAIREVRTRYPGLDVPRTVNEVLRRVITRLIEDVVRQGEANAAEAGVASAHEVRHLDRPLIAFSPDMAKAEKALKGFLYPHMYRHERVNRIMAEAQRVVRELHGHFLACPTDMPPSWHEDLESLDANRLARRVTDYIAGMTDRYALDQHARFFDTTPDLR